MTQPVNPSTSVSRRQLLHGSLGAAAMAAGGALSSMAAETTKAVTKGRIHQSIVHWCFSDHWDVEKTCKVARQLGCESVEIVPPSTWPTLKKYGLQCALAPAHLFVQGMNNPEYQPGCIDLLKKAIDNCVDAGFPAVITFTGYAQPSGPWAEGRIPDERQMLADKRPAIDPDEGLRNCIRGYKKIVGYAEQKKVNLSLEMLNTRVSSHPMKGHPGYQGDHIDYCMEILRQVGSPNLGLLFDIYHVQIMDGDLVTRIKQCEEYINHVHTAGNPGRGELDNQQEINYPPCMHALVDINFRGFVGQEFIPTRDPLEGLTEAVKLCDV